MASGPTEKPNAVEAEKVLLCDGTLMPVLGLGTFQQVYEADTPKIQEAVEKAIDIGYRHFDTASLYKTEDGVGLAIYNKIKQGVITRKDVYVTTKLWCTDFRREDVEPALRRSLDRLKFDYVDNYIMHWPIALLPGRGEFPTDEQGNLVFYDDEALTLETWQAMVQCHQKGLAKTIGLSNFNTKQVQELIDRTSTKPSNLQVEVHPYFQNGELVNWCNRQHITVIAYYPLGSQSSPWREANDRFLADDQVLQSIGNKYGKTVYQVALKFNIQRGLVVIPKSSSPEHMRENMDLNFELTDDEMSSIYSLDGEHRILDGKSVLGSSKNYPF